MSEYFSHISGDGRKQTVLDHLLGTAALCEKFAGHFKAAEIGFLAGLTHDLGKYSIEFQNRLKNNGPKVDHSSAGALECMKLSQPIAAYAVLGHHSGIPDGGAFDDSDGSSFFSRINRAMQGKICDASAWENELKLPAVAVPGWLNRDPLTDIFFTRMLYSCLVDADFLDTAEFMLGELYTDPSYADMEKLNQRLDTYISGWFPPKTDLNRKRCAILSACMEGASAASTELLTLTVPTGGGKTVASLAFALRRAIQPDSRRRRIIYVIPYTSIIEQTADTFRRILGENNVLEHHSGVVFEADDELDKDNVHRARASENWDAPVIVTTAVQFFESLYANRSSACRKLHNIAGSVIIFDEAQMMPLSYLRPCVHAISQLLAHYDVTAVLCTATQPALEPFFREFLPEIEPKELCPSYLQSDDIFRRVVFRQAGRMSFEALAEELNEQRQVLCIVNSRASARELYNLLETDGSAFHLSTMMTPADRRQTLAEIRRRLAENLPCRVVSTSLIEAGVDVDFPIVWREEAGLDSILQAAGRCNREGTRKREKSIVTVFQSDNPPPRLFRQAIAGSAEVFRTQQDISSPQAIRQYFEFYRQIKGEEASDLHHILPQLSRDTIPIRSVAEQFRLIDSDTKTIVIPLGEGQALMNEYRCGKISRTLMRRLGQYSVSVYENHCKSLYAAGDIEAVEEEMYMLTNTAMYDPATGLSLNPDSSKAEFI